MGYFDGLTDACLKEDEQGNTIFFHGEFLEKDTLSRIIE
jgi:hypothetical protein